MLRIMTEKRFQEKLKEAQEKVYEEERLNKRFNEIYEQFDRLYKRICTLENKLLPQSKEIQEAQNGRIAED